MEIHEMTLYEIECMIRDLNAELDSRTNRYEQKLYFDKLVENAKLPDKDPAK
jgi:hypothetical protein